MNSASSEKPHAPAAQFGREHELRLLGSFSDTAPAEVFICRADNLCLVYANPSGLTRIDRDPAIARQLLPRLSMYQLQNWMTPAQLCEVIERARCAAPQAAPAQVRETGTGGRDLQMRAVWFEHDGEALIGFALSDISGWKHAERVQRHEMERWRVALEQSGDGLWDWEVQTGKVFYSPAWPKLLGDAPDGLPPLYAEWLSRIHPGDAEHARQAMTRAFGHPDGKYSAEYRMRCRDGGHIWVLVRGRIVERDADGHPLRMIGTMKSTAETHLLQDSLIALNGDLERRVRERTEALAATNENLRLFTGSVAHDLAAPLRVIEGFANLLREDYAAQLPEDGHKMLEKIASGGKRLRQLLDALLVFFQVTEKAPLHQAVDMNQIVRSVFESHTDIVKQHPVKVTVGPLPPVHGDPHLIEIVFANLIRNSLKFTSECAAPEIEIGATDRDGQTVYFVRDNGAGFDPAFTHKLFQPFERLHAESRFEGSGLGLATVARIISRSGGRIWANGEVGAGATFSFQIGRAHV